MIIDLSSARRRVGWGRGRLFQPRSSDCQSCVFKESRGHSSTSVPVGGEDEPRPTKEFMTMPTAVEVRVLFVGPIFRHLERCQTNGDQTPPRKETTRSAIFYPVPHPLKLNSTYMKLLHQVRLYAVLLFKLCNLERTKVPCFAAANATNEQWREFLSMQRNGSSSMFLDSEHVASYEYLVRSPVTSRTCSFQKQRSNMK
jgi:hypothetical protein